MKMLPAIGLVFAAALATPAQAAILGFENVSLGSTPTVFTLNGATFGFAYDAAAAAQFNPDTYLVQTTGTGQVTSFFGEPSGFFTSANIDVNNNIFPGFAPSPTLSYIPFSLTPTDLGLRYTFGGNDFFGFARLNGDGTLNFAFESSPNTTIQAGSAITGPIPGALAPAVPEPATWAMMLLGFGAIGMAFRRSRKQRPVAIAYAPR